jgi:hypothetical protein
MPAIPPERLESARAIACAVTGAFLAVACAALPGGNAPTVEVLPGGGKDMVAFNADDIACRSTARTRANENTPLPTAMGLGKSEVVASSRGRLTLRDNADSTTGSVYGGALAPDAVAPTAQQRFDTAYLQCMFSKGHKIPMKEQMSS